MHHERTTIVKTALLTRFMLISLQYLSNILIPDVEPEVFHGAKNNETQNAADQLVVNLLGGFVRWDAQYFMHIAKYGYTYENTLAFFPLYPISVRCIANVLNFSIPVLSIDSWLLITSIVLNIIFFVFSSLALYDLSLLVLNKKLAFKAALLYSYNPASIFFIAPYTECMFSYLTFKSMLNSILVYKKYSVDKSLHLQVKDLSCIIPICLSTVTRSNGVLNIGFVVYALVCLYLQRLKFTKYLLGIFKITLVFGTLIPLSVILGLLPFALFQLFTYKMYCTDFEARLPDSVLDHAKLHSYVLPGKFAQYHQSWCLKSLPLSYSYVQSHYWNVGFLKYYELKQVPNFLLAAPVAVIILGNSIEFLRNFPATIGNIFCFNFLQNKHRLAKSEEFSPAIFVFVVHALALTIFCILNVHVQVTTRMLCSASPVLYWFSASHIPSEYIPNILFKALFFSKSNSKSWLILWYFAMYFIVGTVLFCNYLPWT